MLLNKGTAHASKLAGIYNILKNSKSIYDVDQPTAMKWMKEIWENLKEESIFNCWCNTSLIATSNSVLKDPELEASSEIREIKTHLFNVLPIQFHSTINELFILGEQDLGTIFYISRFSRNDFYNNLF